MCLYTLLCFNSLNITMRYVLLSSFYTGELSLIEFKKLPESYTWQVGGMMLNPGLTCPSAHVPSPTLCDSLEIFTALKRESCLSSAEWPECAVSHSALLLYSLEVPNYFTQRDLKSYSKQLASKELAIFPISSVGERNSTSYFFFFTPLLYKNKNSRIKMSKINFKCANVGERYLLSGRVQRSLNRLMCVLCVKCSGHSSN